MTEVKELLSNSKKCKPGFSIALLELRALGCEEPMLIAISVAVQ
jgi:hypothetical protein